MGCRNWKYLMNYSTAEKPIVHYITYKQYIKRMGFSKSVHVLERELPEKTNRDLLSNKANVLALQYYINF